MTELATNTWRLAHHVRSRTRPLTDHIALLRDCYRAEAAKGPLLARAMVILPFSIHAVWQLPKAEEPLERWLGLTDALDRHASTVYEWHSPWVAIVDQADIDWIVQETHATPVAWNLSQTPEDWPYSSVHKLQWC